MSRISFQIFWDNLKNSTPISLSEDPDVNVEVANRAVAMDARARLLCYPRGSFYPLSSALPMKRRRITKTYFRTCSRCPSRSQAGLNFYAFTTISIRSKPTFVPLRYFLAGSRPRKTTHLALSLNPYPGNISKTCNASKGGVSLLPKLPPTLNN